MDAHYRKLNDGSHNSSKYHKKDGTAVRAILSVETRRVTYEETQMDRVESARERGVISEREADEAFDDIMAEANGRLESRR